MHDPEPLTTPPSPRQTLLGLFILFQLAFLVISNFLGFVVWVPGETTDRPKALLNRAVPNFSDEHSHGRSWLDQLETSIRRYTQLTLQDQAWSLFAPSVGKATGFPFVVLVWDEAETTGPIIKGTMVAHDDKNGFHLCAEWNPPTGMQPSMTIISQLGLLGAANPWDAIHIGALAHARQHDIPSRVEVVLSANEPDDVRAFVRYKNCRVRRIEGDLYLGLQPYDEESPITTAERTSRRVRNLVRDYHDSVHAYMRWRLKAWQTAHPDQPPPKQVLLFQRGYRIHGPEEESFDWDGPILYPMARWQPDRKAEGYYAVETFDFSEHRFLPISK
jgi:hypothetical protein